jgi:hypothetical protein
MKNTLSLIILSTLISSVSFAQTNNTLRGKMLFLNSNKNPAQGVEIKGSIEKIERSNVV